MSAPRLLHVGHSLDHTGDGPYHLAASRLTTHGVVVGMTGSGKTGLCIDLLEEVASSGVPVIAIDPKGDLPNLGRPWPASEAARWEEGLRASGVGEDRIAHLRERVEVVVHTPGSTACRPIDVLGRLAAPVGVDDEVVAEAAASAATSVLALAGVHGDPVRVPALVVAAAVVREAWSRGETLDAEKLVLQLVDPPFAKVGFFPVDTFWPRSERMEVAMALNAVLASPTFAPFTEGDPLDIDALLAPVDGRTPVRVLYLAHLDDTARSFFVGLLLSRLVAWMRRQPGTDELRALLFFDEVMGFLPPHPAQPPAKAPMMTLLKQARAFGLGVLLCTQNPVDVDYKALSNAGWWAVGRLDTRQDRDRLLDGMSGMGGDRAELSDAIGALPPWSFLVRDVREPAVVQVKSRWAISYLGGPFTLAQLREAAGSSEQRGRASEPPAPASVTDGDDGSLSAPPPLPRGEQAVWLRRDRRFAPDAPAVLGSGRKARADGVVVYEPALLATVHMLFDERGGFRHEREATLLFYPLADAVEPVVVRLGDDALEGPPTAGRYLPLPDDLDEADELKRFQRRARDEVLRGETTQLYKHGPTRLRSDGGETREAFEARVQAAVAQAVDADVAKLRTKVERQVERLEAKRSKVERDLARHQADAQSKMATEVVNAGETLFGMLFGGRKRSLTSAMSKRSSTSRAQARVGEAESALRELDRELYEAEIQLQEEIRSIEAEHRATAADVEVVEVGLESSDLDVTWRWLWVPQSRVV